MMPKGNFNDEFHECINSFPQIDRNLVDKAIEYLEQIMHRFERELIDKPIVQEAVKKNLAQTALALPFSLQKVL